MLGSLGLTVNGFFKLSRTIVGVAEKVCDGKLVLMVGSGYNPTVLPPCWFALTAGVVGLEKIGVSDPYAPPVEPEWCRRRVRKTLTELKRILKRYWRCFRWQFHFLDRFDYDRGSVFRKDCCRALQYVAYLEVCSSNSVGPHPTGTFNKPIYWLLPSFFTLWTVGGYFTRAQILNS